ncbi:MAG: PAS domain S-box protein [Myxococcales bacterium]|nr:PAS domain S-box protein [Myxococcales bacterium]
MLDQSEHFMALLDLDGNVVDVNQTALALAGLEADAVRGKPFWETPWWAHSAELARLVKEAIRQALAGDTVRFIASHVTLGGDTRFVDFSVKALMGPEGPLYLMPEGRDITELQDAKLRLEESERRYRQIFDTNTAVKIVIDPTTASIVDANDAAVRFYGFSKAELLSKSILDINVAPHDEILEEMERARSERRLFFNFKHRLASGEVRDVEVYSGPITVGGDSLLHSIVIDVTERRRLEEQLRRAQRMEAVGQLAGGIAHDFNNLLTVILGYVELGRRSLAADHPARGSVEEIGDAAQRAADITGQLLALARKQVAEPELMDLNGLVLRLDRLLRRLIGEDVELVTLFGQELPAVLVDPGRFEQLLVNLAVNARDAMPEGGRLTIATDIQADEDDGRWVVLRVTDTGIGMSADVRAHIFEPFFTTKRDGGSGLGLATSSSIVEQAGGRMTVHSEVGQGTTFEILLPAAAGSPAEPVVPPVSEPPHGEGTLLVAEDEPAVHRLIVSTLRRAGYTVLEAFNGDEAIANLKQHEGPLDLVVTDVVMPLMGGQELAKRLWRERPRLPVLFISGYPRDLDELVLSGDNVAFLAKPFAPDALAAKVHALLARHSATVG